MVVQVEGYKTPVTVCTITQGGGSGAAEDLALNEYMDKYLKEHYLFKEEYNTLDVDYASVSYDNFLSTYLLPSPEPATLVARVFARVLLEPVSII